MDCRLRFTEGFHHPCCTSRGIGEGRKNRKDKGAASLSKQVATPGRCCCRCPTAATATEIPAATVTNHVRLTVCLFVRLSECQTVSLSDCQTVRLSDGQTVRRPDCQTARRSVCQTVRLSDCQTVRRSKPLSRGCRTFAYRALVLVPEPIVNTILVELMHAQDCADDVTGFVGRQTDGASNPRRGRRRRGGGWMRSRLVHRTVDESLGDGMQREAVDLPFGGPCPGHVLLVQLIQHFVIIPVEIAVHKGQTHAGPYVWSELTQLLTDPTIH